MLRSNFRLEGTVEQPGDGCGLMMHPDGSEITVSCLDAAPATARGLQLHVCEGQRQRWLS